jgi:hypothetical protein
MVNTSKKNWFRFTHVINLDLLIIYTLSQTNLKWLCWQRIVNTLPYFHWVSSLSIDDRIMEHYLKGKCYEWLTIGSLFCKNAKKMFAISKAANLYQLGRGGQSYWDLSFGKSSLAVARWAADSRCCLWSLMRYFVSIVAPYVELNWRF